MTTTLFSVLRLLSVVLLLLGFNLQLSAATYSVTVPSSSTLTSGKVPVASSGTQLGTSSVGITSSTNLTAPGIVTSYSLTATNGVTVSSGTLSGTAPTWDWTTNSPTMTYTLTGNSTITVAGVPAAGDTWRSVTVAGDGTKTLAFSGITPTYPFGSPPSTVPNGTVTYDFRVIAGTVYGFYSQADLTANSNGLTISGATSGTATLKAAAVAGGTATLPNATGTVILSSSTPATGDILQYTGSGWVTLPVGLSGQVLTAGSSTNSWKNAIDWDDMAISMFWFPATGTTLTQAGVGYAASGTPSRVTPTSSLVDHVSYASAATINNDAGLAENSTMGYVDTFAAFDFVCAPSETTVMRVWIGVASATGTLQGGDDPTTSLAAFRYSTAAGDTNWKTVTNDNSGGGTVTDTGVAVSTSLTRFTCVKISSNYYFYINGSLVTTHTTNLPAAGGILNANLRVRTLENVAKNFKIVGRGKLGFKTW